MLRARPRNKGRYDLPNASMPLRLAGKRIIHDYHGFATSMDFIFACFDGHGQRNCVGAAGQELTSQRKLLSAACVNEAVILRMGADPAPDDQVSGGPLSQRAEAEFGSHRPKAFVFVDLDLFEVEALMKGINLPEPVSFQGVAPRFRRQFPVQPAERVVCF